MKALYAEKDRLIEIRDTQREDFSNRRDYGRELRTVSANIDMILGNYIFCNSLYFITKLRKALHLAEPPSILFLQESFLLPDIMIILDPYRNIHLDSTT